MLWWESEGCDGEYKFSVVIQNASSHSRHRTQMGTVLFSCAYM